MDIEQTYQNEKQFLSITSLLPEEFDLLFRSFQPRWRQWYKHFTFRLKRRKKPLTAAQLNSPTKTLPSSRQKLFFILYFFKINPLQEVAAATFVMYQSQISRWRKVLTPILLDALKDMGLHAARNTDELIRLFRSRQRQIEPCDQVGSFHLDATERPIERNLDHTAQKNDYSGKQHGHTTKNTVICDEKQFVHYVGPTWRGAVHDKAMVDMEELDLSAAEFNELWFSKDSGYQGYRIPGQVHHIEPYKAFRGRPLTAIQKEMNKWISPIRVIVENAIGGIKRVRLGAEKLRHFIQDKADQIIDVATALHNFRVQHREGYAQPHTCMRAILTPFHT